VPAPEPRRLPDRVAAGEGARARIGPAELGAFSVPGDRFDPIDVLEDQATTRVAELVPIRYGRMAESPFAFYRGGAAIMAADLATSPNTGLVVQLGGDAHLYNFGGFASPSRRLLFDANDFDETLPGPFEWDVKRLAASFAIAARQNAMPPKVTKSLVRSVVAQYRRTIGSFAAMDELDVWHSVFDTESVLKRWSSQLDRRDAKTFERMFASARKRDSRHAYAKLTHAVGAEPRFLDDPPLLVRLETLLAEQGGRQQADRIADFLAQYRQSLPDENRHLIDRYRLVDVARKVVGVGSVGTRTFVALMLGRDDGDSLLLQVKEAKPSVLEAHLGPSTYPNCGQRVVEGQRLLQGVSDFLLGWGSIEGIDDVRRDFYIRQLWDWKLSLDVERLTPTGLAVYGEMCGWSLARGHARSGDAVAIASYCGDGDELDRSITSFALAYAARNADDHAQFLAAIEQGRIRAEVPAPQAP